MTAQGALLMNDAPPVGLLEGAEKRDGLRDFNRRRWDSPWRGSE